MVEKVLVIVVCLLVFGLPFLAVWLSLLFVPPPKGESRRFSLRALLLALTIASLALGYVVYEARK
jgi:hypothetical protein